jgi:plasmid stabilization system protein ParE
VTSARRYAVRVTNAAEDDAAETAQWIRDHWTDQAAERFIAQVVASAKGLALFPEAHEYRSEYGARRSTVRGSRYSLWFDIIGDHVVVLALTSWSLNPATVREQIRRARLDEARP